MRANNEQPKDREGLPGIRRGVWLVTLGPISLWTLFLLLPGHPVTRDSTPENAASAVPRQHSNLDVHPRGIRFIPAYHRIDPANENWMDMIEQQIEDRRTWVDDPGRNLQ